MKRVLTHRLIFFILLCAADTHFSTHANEQIKNAVRSSDYIICIDGGGSKTEIQVIDSRGTVLPIVHNDMTNHSILIASSNINSIGNDQFEELFRKAFDRLFVQTNYQTIKLDPTHCALIGGFAGAGRHETKNLVTRIFEKLGFKSDHIAILADVELALESIGNGAVLISGTGSICMARSGNQSVRVGGLGRLIGDNASGYFIGISALQAALECEYGYGKKTMLTDTLKQHYGVDDLKTVIGPVHNGGITPTHIAAAAPFVFQAAQLNDFVAQKIIKKTANGLAEILATTLTKLEQKDCTVLCIGGVFKNEKSEAFIQTMLNNKRLKAAVQKYSPTLVNKAHENIALTAVQSILKS